MAAIAVTWVSGQLTAGGVPAVEFAWHNYDVGAVAKDRRNLPKEFVQWMDATGNPGGCWVSKNCFEPLPFRQHLWHRAGFMHRHDRASHAVRPLQVRAERDDRTWSFQPVGDHHGFHHVGARQPAGPFWESESHVAALLARRRRQLTKRVSLIRTVDGITPRASSPHGLIRERYLKV